MTTEEIRSFHGTEMLTLCCKTDESAKEVLLSGHTGAGNDCSLYINDVSDKPDDVGNDGNNRILKMLNNDSMDVNDEVHERKKYKNETIEKEKDKSKEMKEDRKKQLEHQTPQVSQPLQTPKEKIETVPPPEVCAVTSTEWSRFVSFFLFLIFLLFFFAGLCCNCDFS